jgi:hypothetical protein
LVAGAVTTPAVFHLMRVVRHFFSIPAY